MKEETMKHFSGLTRTARIAAIALCAGAALCSVGGRAFALPSLDELMADFNFSKDDVQRVRSGELVDTSAKETSDRELAVVMVFLVKAPVQKLIAFLKEGPSPRNDPQVQAVTEIKGEGTLDDFKAVVLKPGGDKETQRYLDAAPGDKLNLSLPEIASFAALKGAGGAGQPQVEEAVRKMLLARYQAYRAQGLSGIAPYARGKDKQSQPADDLRRATEAAKGVKKYTPAFYDVLMNYPQGTPAGLTQHFFCIRYAMDGRPNFALRQRLALPVEDAYVIADRDFYVSSGYNDTQAVGALLPVENGTVVVYLNRTTTDQLGGFGASAKQSIGRGMMAKQIKAIFEKARAGFKDK
jgi:hypothetical protein